MHRISVVVADDHRLFRAGVIALLRSQPDIIVVGEAETSDGVVALCRELLPEVVLLDVEMPTQAAEATVRQLRRCAPQSAIVILTMHNVHVLRSQLLGAGAVDYLTKDVDPRQLATCVRTARMKLTNLGENLHAAPRKPPHVLSTREIEILRMVAQARSNREIGVSLAITEGTVKRHTTNIYLKLGAASRIDAVRKARILGLLV